LHRSSSIRRAIALFALLVLGAAATAVAQEKITIRWAEYPRAGIEEFAAEATALFSQLHPEIEVIYEPVVDPERLTTAMIAGTGPDVVAWWTDHLRGWGESGLLIDLGPYMDRDFTREDFDDFNPGQMREFTLPSGSRYALPLFGGTLAMWYNKNRVNEAGLAEPDENLDWASFREMARKLTRRIGDATEQWGVQAFLSYERVVPWVWQNGGRTHPPGDNSVSLLNEPKAAQAIQFLADLMHQDLVMPVGGMQSNEVFRQGRVGMEIEGSWAINWYMSDPDLEIGIAHLPRGEAGRASVIAYEAYGINRESPNRDAAWLWLKFLTGREANEIRARTLGLQPARRSAAFEWFNVVRDTFPAAAGARVEVFAETWAYAEPAPMYAKNLDAMSVISQALLRIFNQGEPAQIVLDELIPPLNVRMAN